LPPRTNSALLWHAPGALRRAGQQAGGGLLRGPGPPLGVPPLVLLHGPEGPLGAPGVLHGPPAAPRGEHAARGAGLARAVAGRWGRSWGRGVCRGGALCRRSGRRRSPRCAQACGKREPAVSPCAAHLPALPGGACAGRSKADSGAEENRGSAQHVQRKVMHMQSGWGSHWLHVHTGHHSGVRNKVQRQKQCAPVCAEAPGRRSSRMASCRTIARVSSVPSAAAAHSSGPPRPQQGRAPAACGLPAAPPPARLGSAPDAGCFAAPPQATCPGLPDPVLRSLTCASVSSVEGTATIYNTMRHVVLCIGARRLDCARVRNVVCLLVEVFFTYAAKRCEAEGWEAGMCLSPKRAHKCLMFHPRKLDFVQQGSSEATTKAHRRLGLHASWA